eukprot:COSAG06_NODE_23432_length_692_cov_0.698145_1_plen_54_part_01
MVPSHAEIYAGAAARAQQTALPIYNCEQVTDAGVSAVGAGCAQLASLNLSRCKK